MAELLTELTCAIRGHDWPEWEPSIRFAGHPTESRYCRRCDLWGWRFACDCRTMCSCLPVRLNDGSEGA